MKRIKSKTKVAEEIIVNKEKESEYDQQRRK